jgi:hypothetical protein
MAPTRAMSSFHIFARWLVIVLVALAIAGCAAQKRAKRAAPAKESALGEALPPPHVSSCREYADGMAGRQMERDIDSISGNFQGGDGTVLQEFARMDAQRYYRQLYESCLSQQRDVGAQPAAR